MHIENFEWQLFIVEDRDEEMFLPLDAILIDEFSMFFGCPHNVFLIKDMVHMEILRPFLMLSGKID